jgi:hypothetical protein
MLRVFGILAVIPIAILLAIAYFVALTAQRAEAPGLKNLARFVVALLWISAVVVLAGGLAILITGQHPAVLIAKEIAAACR